MRQRFYDGTGIDSDTDPMQMGRTGGLIASGIEALIGGIIYYSLRDETIATQLLASSLFLGLAAFHGGTAVYDIIQGYREERVTRQ